jgi:hypothetical protein
MTQEFDSTRSSMVHRREFRAAHRACHLGILTVFAVMVALPGCGEYGDDSTKINGSIHVPAGKQPGAVATVNGSIEVDDKAAVTSAKTVNGSVRLGDHATGTSLASVNGAISLGAGAHVSGNVSSVNGELTLAEGAEVAGALSNVNGMITLSGAHVAGGIRTINGSMSITGASHVEGGILVKQPSGLVVETNRDVPRIVIGPGATVQGELRFERAVQLYVSDKATVGTVTGATPISFTGDTPPN